MIQPNELRLGNWVLVAGTGDVHAAQINIDNLRQIVKDGGIALPIPLTPEILEKAGFNLRKESGGYMGFVLVDFEVGFTYGNFYFDATNREGYRNEVYVEIKYVHQLQNLYFALTGTELEINLK